jgi:hypothetical protein
MSARIGLLKAGGTLSVPQIAVALALVLGISTLIFGVWTATSAWSFPLFVVAVVMLIYFPGKLLLDIVKLRLKPLEDLILSLVLGMTVTILLYWIFALLGLRHLFALWPLAAAIVYFYRRRKRWREIWRSHLSFDVSHVLLLGVIILSLIPLATLPMYYHNLALLPQGDMTFLHKPRDVIFHLSIANELTHSIPPQVPFLSGRPLGYHYAMDLLVALFGNSAWLSVLDLTVRFVPTFFLIITVLAVFCFGRVWLHSPYGAVLAAFLVIFGEDFSFIPGLLLGSREIWSAQFFGAPTVYSLYFVNPMLPALGVLFSGLFCLVKFCEGERRGWMILTAFLFAIVMEYKVFVTAQVLAGLAVAGCIYLILVRDTRLLRVLALTIVLAAPLGLYSLLGAEAGSGIWVRFDPWPYIPEALEQLGLLKTSLGYQMNVLFTGGPKTFIGVAMVFLVALPGYLLGSLGMRVLAFPGLLKELFSPSYATVVRFFVAIFVILGPLITLTVTVTPQGYPPEFEYNNAGWFYGQSKYVVWIFAVEFLIVLLRGKRRFWQAVTLSVVLGLSIPSAAQYFHSQMSHKLETLDQNELELMDFLSQSCSQGEVVFSRQNVGTSLVAVTKCRVPVLNLGIYTHPAISKSGLEQRRTDRDDFWNAWNGEELRDDILERYEVVYVVVDRRVGDVVPVRPFWTTGSDSSAVTQMALHPYFENEDFVVYKVWNGHEQAK